MDVDVYTNTPTSPASFCFFFDRTLLRSLVRLALEGKGGFKASSVRMDNLPYALTPALDFEAPVQVRASVTLGVTLRALL